MIRVAIHTLTMLLAVACGGAQTPVVMASAPAEPVPVAASQQPESAPVAEGFDRLLGEAYQYTSLGQLARADEALGAARKLANEDPSTTFPLLYLEATLNAYRGDFKSAAGLLHAYLSTVDRLSTPAPFFLFNALCLLHQAEGDLMAAFVACDEMGSAGRHGTWGNAEMDRVQMTSLKVSWHRAYLLRLYAEGLPAGAVRDSVKHSAALALDRYRQLATPLGTYGDSVAVLEGLFAIHDGDHARALAAAGRVDVEKNGDLEDLYLAQLAFEFGGDSARAEAIRTKIRSTEQVSLAVPIIRLFLEKDEQNRSGTVSWTPRYPTPASKD